MWADDILLVTSNILQSSVETTNLKFKDAIRFVCINMILNQNESVFIQLICRVKL